MFYFFVTIALFYLLICLFFRLRQSHFIFASDLILESTPNDAGLDYEAIALPANAGEAAGSIDAWWVPCEMSRDTTPVILFCHGNRCNLGDSIEHALWFHQLGWSSLLIDYRGYGNSQGPFPSEASVFDDADVALRYLVDERHIAPQRIVVYGHSLGGAVAIALATRYPKSLAGVIVEGTFTSILDMAWLKKRNRLLPIKWLLTERLDNLAKVRSLSTPILFLHGKKDQIVPFWMGEKLFAAALEPKHKAFFPEAGHNSIALLEGDRYLNELQQFVNAYTTKGSRQDESLSKLLN